jgi:energy-coupling factor transporter ATP-binding protein EcfA2
VLANDHLAIKGAGTEPVSLVSVTHHRGVNALAPEQTITFGTNLTIVYGPNAAGKSGYTRILKRACRSRSTEEILGNVLSGEAPLKPQATIRFREGDDETVLNWNQEAPPSGPLAAVSVFDSQCAPVYLRDKTDVAFRPFGLDIFDRLAAICGEVHARLETEYNELNRATPSLPILAEGTKARALIDDLTSLTKVDEVRKLATLSRAEERRLKELYDQKRDLQAADPKQRARDLDLKAQRLEIIVQQLRSLGETLGDAALASLRAAADSLRVAREALAVLRKATLTPDLLPGTGEGAWRTMWEAAVGFSGIAYPGSEFPALPEGARCPLCQQEIGSDAASRLEHFKEYLSSSAQAEVRSAEDTYDGALVTVTKAVVNRDDIDLALDELAADDPDLAEQVRSFLRGSIRIQQEVNDAVAAGAQLPAKGVGPSPVGDLASKAKALRDRAKQLRLQTPSMEPSVLAELQELQSRLSLNEHRQAVEDEIERKKRLAAYRQCIEDTSTQAITRKSTELTKRLVTDQLRRAFQDELSKLEFKHLAVEIQAGGGAKGALYHRLVFTNAPGVAVTNVVSEGESRALSLAAFLTELSTADRQSAIIFDDPVSSLDHDWRKRIAHRLVEEAKGRQVIVFTHDILFLRFLLDESRRRDVPCRHQYLRRDGQTGISAPDLPWIAMGVKDRIGTLRNRWQAAEKLYRTDGAEAYEKEAREIYGLLREAWEQAVSEVLLNGVVERYRHSIETQKVRHLHDITEEDCKAVEDGMTECSRWIRGHDQPPANGTPFPQPASLQERIQDLDDWVQRIRKRRK